MKLLFSKGQRLKLIDNTGMSAPKGAIATARVDCLDAENCNVDVVWADDAPDQFDGEYRAVRFAPADEVASDG